MHVQLSFRGWTSTICLLMVAVGLSSPAAASTVTVVVEAPGLSAEDVESLVAFPVESSVSGLARVRSVRSASELGRLIVWVTFEPGGDISAQRQHVAERLQTVQDRLPAKARPMLSPQRADSDRVLRVALCAAEGEAKDRAAADAIALRSVTESALRLRLLRIPGVADVIVAGGQRKQYQVIASPDRLVARDITVRQLFDALRQEIAGEKPTAVGKTRPTVDDLSSVVVTARDGVPIFVQDVATVCAGGIADRGDASVWLKEKEAVHGGPAVMLTVLPQPEANPNLEKEIRKALDEIRVTLPPAWRLLQQTFHHSDVTVHLRASGDDDATRLRLAQRAEKLLLDLPEATALWRQTAPRQASGPEPTMDGCLLHLRLSKSSRTRDEVLAQIRSRLAELPGVTATLHRPVSQPADPLALRSDGVIKCFGDDLAVLRRLAESLRAQLQTVPGVADLRSDSPANETPQMQVEIDREAAARHGVPAAEIADILATARTGRPAGELLENGQRVEVVVQYEGAPRGPEELSKLRLATPSGKHVPFGSVARITLASAPAVVYRENLKRCVIISYNVHGRPPKAVAKQLATIKESFVAPSGYFLELAPSAQK